MSQHLIAKKMIQEAEEERRNLKLEALRQEVAIGLEQLENGQYSDYDDDSLPTLLENIKARGRRNLQQFSEQ